MSLWKRIAPGRLRAVLVIALAAGLGTYGVGSVLAVPPTTIYACVLNNIS
jgi:hypothetical protein